MVTGLSSPIAVKYLHKYVHVRLDQKGMSNKNIKKVIGNIIMQNRFSMHLSFSFQDK